MARQRNRSHRRAATRIQSVNQWHHRIIELMIHEPTFNQAARADALGVSQAWLCQVEGSDLFQDELARAREAHRELLSYDTIDRVKAVADLSLETIAEKIERERADLGLTELKDTAVDMMRVLGYGGQGSGANHQVNVAVAVDAGLLERARERMRLVGRIPKGSQVPLPEPPLPPEGGDLPPGE